MVNYTKQVKNKPSYDSREYNWLHENGQGVSGDLSASGAGKVLTFLVRPYGLAVGGFVYVSAGVGTAEACEITALSGTAGSAGTCTITTANTHTGAWRAGSATVGIQEAINALPSSGGVVSLPEGTLAPYKGFTIANRSGVTVEGQGITATRIDIRSLGAGHVAKMTSGAANWLRKFTIGGLGVSAGMTSSDYAIIFDDQNSSGVEHVTMVEVPNGIHVTNNMAVYGNYRLWVQYVDIGYLVGAGSVGIQIDGGADHFLSHIAFGAMTGSLASIRIRWSGGTTIQNVDALTAGLLIDPDGVGNNVTWCFINAAMFDSTTNEPWKIAPTNGAIVSGIISTNGWFASSVNSSGIHFEASLPSKIEDISLTATRSVNNHGNGIALVGDGVRDIIVASSIIASNSVASAGLYHGIYVDGASDLIITGNTIGALPGLFANHGAGILFDTGATDNIIVTGNLIKDSVVSPILGMSGITGLNRIVKDNSGSSLTLPTVASATTLDLTEEAYEHFTVTGTTAVTTISPAWYGRQITLTKADAGTVNFNTGGNIKVAKTLDAGQTLICVYDAGGWGIIGP